jgi:two-component system sensor histidine kinase VicK
MFLKSLQWRLVSFFCMIAVCLIIPIGLFLNKSVEDQYYKDFKSDIDNGFRGWTISIDKGVDAEQIYNDLRDNNASLFYIIGENKSYTVVDRNTNDIYSSDQNYDSGQKGTFLNELLDSNNFVRALGGEIGGEKKLEQYDGRVFFDYARPVGDFVLYFRYYQAEWQPVVNNFSKIIMSSLLIAFVIAFILGYILSKTVTVPIVRIMHKAESIASGDFDQVLEVRSDDEIGRLTSTFNYMAENLKNTLVQISSEKNKIETILNYMTDGVVAFNMDGEVIHTNPACRQMLGKEESEGTFNDYAKRYGLNVRLNDIIHQKSPAMNETKINVDDKILRVYFAVFTDEMKQPGGIIAVLQDITKQQKLEEMRKEFVANVSHELRTPLTSIKSYAETLLDGALEDNEIAVNFLKVINSEADRMTRLVKDLLQLSRLDNQQMQWNMKKVSLVELVKSSVDKIMMEAKAKGQRLECLSENEIPDIMADYDRLEQVMLNILSNAIKYTPERGKITISVAKVSGDICVKIADNGIGIPKEDMTRIFERFYRVDKARSREMGGTGLGLAIAKEIIEAHSGSITITSETGGGTEVTVKIPAA